VATVVDEARITIEIHTELLIPTPFVRPLRYGDLMVPFQTFACGGRQAQTLRAEDMLWHVFAHAFVVDVLRPPQVRLISVADVIAAVEQWVDVLDWDRLRHMYPRAVRALPLIGQIVPWSAGVERRLGCCLPPRTVRACQRSTSRLWRAAFSRGTWWPAAWWFDVRYGADGRGRRIWSRLITHPASVMLAAADAARRKYCIA
jgi:hypothetical protein